MALERLQVHVGNWSPLDRELCTGFPEETILPGPAASEDQVIPRGDSPAKYSMRWFNEPFNTLFR